MRENGHSIEFDPNVPIQYVNAVYWELLDERIRPYLRHHVGDTSDDSLVRVDHHKIASLVELVITRVINQAFKYPV